MTSSAGLPSSASTFFESWNQVACGITIPPALVKGSKPEVLLDELITTIGPEKLKSAQRRRPRSFHLEFCDKKLARAVLIGGVEFRGVLLTPYATFKKTTSVYVSKVPPEVPDSHFLNALAPFGVVQSLRHLSLKNRPGIQSGTRLVRMVVEQPIPYLFKVWDFPALASYSGQPKQCFKCRQLGHTYPVCPAPPSQHRHRSRTRTKKPSVPPASLPATEVAAGTAPPDVSSPLIPLDSLPLSTPLPPPPKLASVGVQTLPVRTARATVDSQTTPTNRVSTSTQSIVEPNLQVWSEFEGYDAAGLLSERISMDISVIAPIVSEAVGEGYNEVLLSWLPVPPPMPPSSDGASTSNVGGSFPASQAGRRDDRTRKKTTKKKKKT